MSTFFNRRTDWLDEEKWEKSFLRLNENGSKQNESFTYPKKELELYLDFLSEVSKNGIV